MWPKEPTHIRICTFMGSFAGLGHGSVKQAYWNEEKGSESAVT